jgi:tetratricopeptide (TPR) repeat protein
VADQTNGSKTALEQARTAFQAAIKLVPEAFEGYWYMTTLCEREGQWEEGLQLCAQCLQLQPRLEGRFRSKRADFLRMLKKFPEAEAELELALHADKTGAEPVQAMMALADAYYQEQGDREAALRLYRLTRETRENTFDAEYENLIGNLHYYFKEYAEAAKAYQDAVAKAPKNAALYSNLALALEQMTAVDRAQQFDEIINALRYACRLVPGNAEYSNKLAKFEHRKRFLLHYGEPALDFTPAVTPIQPVLEAGLFDPILTSDKNALRDPILEKISAIREELRTQFGLTIPGVSFTDITLGSPRRGTYYVLLMWESKEQGCIPPQKSFVSVDDPQASGLSGDPPELTGEVPGPRGLWLDQSQAALAREKGLTVLDPADFLLARLKAVLEHNLADLVHYELTVSLLKQSTGGPRDEILKNPERVVALTRILKGLLSRRASIENMDAIVVAFDQMWRRGMNHDAILENLASRHHN